MATLVKLQNKRIKNLVQKTIKRLDSSVWNILKPRIVSIIPEWDNSVSFKTKFGNSSSTIIVGNQSKFLNLSLYI